jgi:hypothetical protein
MSESPPRPTASATADKLLGALATVALVVIGLASLSFLQSLLERRDTATLASIPDVLVTWREGGDLLMPMALILFAPAVLMQAAFGADKRSLSPGGLLTRRVLIGASVLCVAAGVGWGAVAGRQETAVATPFGISWLHDGKPREYWTWGAASDVGLGCAVTKDAKTGQVVHALNYDVTVPSGRIARLVRDEAEIPKLIARLTPIDQSLRARGVPRFASVEAPCLQHYAKGLTPAEQAGLRTLLSR